MADIADVEQALCTAIAAALYPDGTSNPSAVAAPCKIYRGWPNAAALDIDLAAGIVNVTVFNQAGLTRNTSRYPVQWLPGTVTEPTLTVSAANDTVTIGGAGGVKQNVGIRTNHGAWAVTAAPTDGPTDVAAALRALIPGATGTGATVTVSPFDGLRAVTGGFGIIQAEVRRQVAGFMITCWCPNPTLRDQTASLIDIALSQIEWLELADGYGGRLIYHNSFTTDTPSKDALWRRNLTYTVEYPTVATRTAAEMLFGGGLMTVGTANLNPVPFGDI